MPAIRDRLRPLFYRSQLLAELRLLAYDVHSPRLLYRGVRWGLVRLFRREATIKTAQGVFAVSTSDTAIARELYCRGGFELQLIRGLPQLLREMGFAGHSDIDTIYDVGANIGPISIGMLALGIARRAVAIEPEPGNFRLLTTNVRLNSMEERFLCLNCACSDTDEDVQLELSQVNHGDHRVRRSLPDAGVPSGAWAESGRDTVVTKSRRLDEIVTDVDRHRPLPRGAANVVWVDVQGHEGFVFRGGAEFFRTGVPTVAEFWPYGIVRSGMSAAEYLETVSSVWSGFVDLSAVNSGRRPITALGSLFEDLLSKRMHTNVLYCR